MAKQTSHLNPKTRHPETREENRGNYRRKRQPSTGYGLTAEDLYGSGMNEEMSAPMPEPGKSVFPGASNKRSSKINLSTARAVFESLKKPTGNVENDKKRMRKYKKDKCTTSKKLLKAPTAAWAKNTSIADVPSIDAPGKCTTKTVKGEKVTKCTIPKGSKYDKVCNPPAKKGKKGKGKKSKK